MKKALTVGYWSVLLFYSYLLIDTVFLARDARRSINLVPFDMIAQQGFSLNVYGNILMFVPLGLYIANSMKPFRFWKVLVAIVGTSFAIEVLQYVFKRGASDIDDLLLNTAGGLIGIFIYYVFKLAFKSKERIQMAISALSLIVGIPVMILAALVFLAN
ncbi:MAG: VanZ family protein [Solibacillus sp.]